MHCSLKTHFILANSPGVVSLVTKSFFLAVAIILAKFGFHKDRPFLLHCIDANSTLLDTMDNDTLCTNLASCFSEPTKANFTDFSGVLRLLEEAHHNLEEEANKTALVKEKVEEVVQNLGEQMKKELQKMEQRTEHHTK